MRYLLFTTTTCPKCPAMKEAISEQIKFDGEIVDDLNPSFFDKAKEFNISSVPTLIIFENDDIVGQIQDPSQLPDLLEKL